MRNSPVYQGPILTDRIAILADHAVKTPLRRIYGKKLELEDSRYLDAFSFAQLQVANVLRSHPDWSDAAVVKPVRLRVASYLANDRQAINVPRSENQQRRAAGLDPIYMRQKPEPSSDEPGFLKRTSFVAQPASETTYSVCEDDHDCDILDSLLAGRSIDETAAHLKLPRDKTRGRVDGMKSYREGYHPKRGQTAEPSILLKARDEYRRDHKAGDYKLSRIFWYCCRDLADHHALSAFFDGKESDANRLGRIAHRFLEM